MSDFILVKFVVDLILFLLLIVKFEDVRDVPFLHSSDLTDDIDSFFVWQLVLSHHVFDAHACRAVGVLDFDEFVSVDKSVHVVGC